MHMLKRALSAIFVTALLAAAPFVSADAASFNKFYSFVDYLAKGTINLNTDTIKVMLTNTCPVDTNTTYSSISSNELASGDGYTTGGATVAGTGVSNSSGTETMTADATTWTSNTGSMGPFECAVYYDATASGDPLIGWYSNGSSVTLNGANGDTFTVTPAGGDLLTLARNDRIIPFIGYAANDNWPIFARLGPQWRHAG